MPDLLASTILLPLKPGIPPRAAPFATPVVDFMAMLGELVLSPGSKLPGGKGQPLAADGKILPGAAPEGDEEEDADRVIAWLPAGLVPLPPIEPAPLPGIALVDTPEAAIATGGAASPVGEIAITLVLPEVVASADASIAAAEPGPALADGGMAAAEPPPATPAIEPDAKTAAAMRELSRPASAPVVTPQPVVPGASPAPIAAHVFAAAISAALDSPGAAAPPAPDPAAVQNPAAAAEQLRTTVQAMSGAERLPLDLGRDDWAGKMVDRIAALRDAAEAADTRIRLAPENLGNVDVSIRREGDRLHVHFAAENPATRQLLAEAAPRLAELADARGVKLGQTSVDAGAGGQQDAPSQPQSNQPPRPASAAAQTFETDRDHRVA